jgi:hypothetical protein
VANEAIVAKKEGLSRPAISKALEVALCAQVDQACPNCAKPLFKRKGKATHKEYEIAHIYPLHPTPSELELLKGQERLSPDPNHDHNLIPLCFSCHNIFDNPKTIDGYLALVEKKKRLIKKSEQLEIFQQYHLEQEIINVINLLLDDEVDFGEPISLEAKTIDTKLDSTIKPLTKTKIKNDVSSFYLFVRDRFAEMEKLSPMKAVLIAQQVKTFYVKQKSLSLSQQEIFHNTVNWIRSKFHASSQEAAEVIAAFYIQNCELFE